MFDIETKKVLITGGAGFIGSNVARYLIDKGHDVVLLDSLIRRGVSHNLKWLKEAKFVKGDIRERRDIMKCGNVDIIYHCAANPGIPISLENPMYDFDVNAIGTMNMLEYARHYGSSLIYASTNKVYGEKVNNIPIAEEATRYDYKGNYKGNGIPSNFSTDGKDHSPYGCSKLTGDLYCREYSTNLGVPTIVTRMSCIYGIMQYGQSEQGWVSHFIASAILNKKLEIFGNGKQVRDCLFGEDLAELIYKLINNFDKYNGSVFNVGGGYDNTISLTEMIKYLKKKSGHKIDLHYNPWRPADHRVYYQDISDLEGFWKPKTSVLEGFDKVWEWIEKNKDIFKTLYKNNGH